MQTGTNTSKAGGIRKKFRDWVRLRTSQEPPQSMLETTVLQGGCYVGRRFSLMGFHLLWLIEPQQVKLIGPDGSLIESESLEDFFQAHRGDPQADAHAASAGSENPTGSVEMP